MNDTNNITSDNNIDTIITVEGLVGESELAGDGEDAEDDEIFKWTWITIIQSIVLFLLAGIAEIIGGWMVWQAVRGNGDDDGETDNANNNNNNNNNNKGRKPWYYGLIGSIILIIYGFIPTLQPTSNFGRIYAVYGGVFIVLSYIFGWLLDGIKPDIGDISGGSIALIGVCVAMFWPR